MHSQGDRRSSIEWTPRSGQVAVRQLHHDLHEALVPAATNRHVQVYKFLRSRRVQLEAGSPFFPFTLHQTLYPATVNGHVAMVEHLLTECSSYDVSPALTGAIAAGNVDVVRLLLASGNQYDHHATLISAAATGRTDIVELLLPTSDLDSITDAIGSASFHGHTRPATSSPS